MCCLPHDRSIPTRQTPMRSIEIGGRFLVLLVCLEPPSMVICTMPSAVAPPIKTGAAARIATRIRGWCTIGKSMMSMGNAKGMKVLDGALRKGVIDGSGLIGEVDLPRAGIVFP